MKKQRHALLLAGALAPVLFLVGCASSPGEKDFIANADKQMKSRDKTVCLPVQGFADYASVAEGPMPNGWTVVLDSAQDSIPAGMRVHMVAKYEAMVQAGLAQKEPYQLHKNGTLVAGTRYSLSPEGRKALSFLDMGSCIELGHWKAKGLIQPRSGVQDGDTALIRKKAADGANPSYEAYVAYELSDAPAWATDALLSAFPELSQLKAGKSVKVELVQFNKEWVSKSVLAQKLAKESYASADKAEKTPALIPDDLLDAAVAKINKNPPMASGDGAFIRLPVQEGSETTRALTAAKPGAVFLASTPDPKFREQEMVEAQLQALDRREKSTQDLPADLRTKAMADIQRERQFMDARMKLAAPTDNTAYADRYLNARQELTELLDALIEAGAYEKRDVKADEVPGVPKAGVLYTPKAGTLVQGSTVRMGMTKFTRIKQQEVLGGALLLSVEYEITNQPAWLATLLQKHPQFGSALKGVRGVIARPADNPEMPYTFRVR